MGVRKKQKARRRHAEVPEEPPGVSGHPVQGRWPHVPGQPPRESEAVGPFDPYGWVPGAISPRVAGSGGFVSGGRHMSQGPFAGVGPVGYARSDARILEDVCDRLTEHGELDVREVTVEVRDGEVSLAGAVPDRFTKRGCERVADDVVGVRDVHNRLRIAPKS